MAQIQLTVVVCAVLAVLSVEAAKSHNPCASKQSCHDCIRTPTCVWCYDPNFDEGQRCFQPSSRSRCDLKYVYNPSNTQRIVQAKKLMKASSNYSYSASSSSWSSSSSSSSRQEGYHDAVQITPQRVSLKLRVNEEYRIKFTYAHAEDYPVDLYYLMDLSKSMEDDKDKLSHLGNLLAERMRNITSNFRLGFGSFVDKVVMPYVSTVPKNLVEPCTGCAAPYGYLNVMSLSQDTGRFAEEVKNAKVSGNLDAPEGGFDAIMQAVVCREQIGWREKARRLLVFSTDAGFHYAGDGKLGGIVKPNDGECHLDSRGSYTHSTINDYPSISQVNLKVKQNAINVIFAVTAEQIHVYSRLQKNVEGSSSGTLTGDSSNVVELVKEQYDKITSSVEMKDNSTGAVKITYNSSCLGDTYKDTNKCDKLKVQQKVQFEAKIEVTKCPERREDWQQVIQIYPVGINESLIIDLEMLCDCPCERPPHPEYEEDSDRCSGHGTYMCGVCECDALHFGRKCECSSDNTHGHKELDFNSCRPDNTSLVDCSGRGTCVCGICQCEERTNPLEEISGQFCECDNFSCDYSDGQLCSGPERGTCVCGKCSCLPGWTGSACNCRASNETCMPPNGKQMCHGNGECICGECVCKSIGKDGRYPGKFCEMHQTPFGHCLEFKECVQCLVYKTGPLSEEDCETNCTFKPIIVESVKADEEKDEILCAYYDEDDCRFQYVYTYDEDKKPIVKAQEKRDCPPEIHVLGIVLGVILAIVLIGLALLLLWKLLTTIHDRREFAKFEKERMMAKWDTGENPIYKQATSTFKNPTYAGK